MFRRGPFTLAHDREARAVDNEMQAGTRGGATQREVEMLATPGERGVIGRGQVETQHPEDRRQEAFSLPQRQVEDEPERQRGFDGKIGILPLPATFADAHGLPSGDRIRGQPHGDIASLDQRSVVCRPIPDVVFCLVLWVHARLHVEIMHLLSPRWPGGRSWLTEGAGPCTNASSARDHTINTVKSLGRRRWKKTSRDQQHARVENAFFRYTSIIGDGLRAKTPGGRTVEAQLACNMLNAMTDMGRPASYAVGR